MNGIRNTVSALGEMGGELVRQVALEVSGDTFKDKLRAFTTDLEDKYEDLQQRRLLLHALRKDLEREVQRCREKETTSSYSLWITKASEIDEEVNDLVSRYEAAKQASYGFLHRPSLSSEVVEEKLKAIKELVDQKSYMENKKLDFCSSKIEVGAPEPMNLDESDDGLSYGIIKSPPSPRKPSNFMGAQKNPLLRLDRIRDVVSLWLSYPVRKVHDSKLKAWIHRLSNAHGSVAEKYSLILEDPLHYLEELVPIEMLMENETEASCSSMVDQNKIPDAILNLAADLAINQLVQILLSGDGHALNIRCVMICTRNNAERRQVFKKLKVVLKDIDDVPCFNEIFHGVLWVDVSMSQSQANVEADAKQQVNLQLRQLSRIGQSNHQSMIRKKYLVVVFDGYAEKTIDMRELNLPIGEAIIVLITTESRKQANDKRTKAIDLAISTSDHLLPWRVFCQTVGNELVFSYGALQEIAVRIVQECGGHLLAIVLLAKSLKNVKDVKFWELALNKLCCLNPSCDMNMFQDVSKVMVTTFINFIWNDMDQTLKHCLMSCLFIPDVKISKFSTELVHHWISYQLTDHREAMHILSELVERSILIRDQSNDLYVKLPEDTYAILHSLNTLTPFFMKKSGLGLTEPPKDEEWHSVVHMELANNKLAELPLSPSNPELKVLMLQGNVDLTRVPSTFFFKMPLLTILDLSYTSVRELPDSLFELEQLTELSLKDCECFMKLSPKIGKLKKLEKLDLDGTQIIHLPEEIQELTRLQSLFLCFYEYRGKKGKQYTCLTIIPSEVISKLKELKHLGIDVSPNDERWYKNVRDILPEILGLEHLLTLSLYIPHLELLKSIPDRILWWADFRFIVGRHMQRIISSTPCTCEAKFRQSGCSVKFVNGDDVPNEIGRLVRHSKALFLERHKTINSLSGFNMMNLEQLRICMLAECREMQTVVDGRKASRGNDIFSHLLYLYISHMKSLGSIWEGPIPPRCFLGMLKSLVLQNCPELTTVFTLDFLGNLSLLKEIIVKDCPKVTTLISDGSFKHKGEVFLPKLRKILLLHLPELITISNGYYIAPSLNTMGIYDCPKLQSLSKSELSSPILKVIKGEMKWWGQLQWSKEECGIPQRPSKFDGIFSSIDNQVDIMTQMGNDGEDIDDDADMMSLQTLFEHPMRNAGRFSRMTFSVSRKISELEDRTLDDGYRWRKYGQKTVAGSKIPSSYYKCTYAGCPAKRKITRRSEEDPKIVGIVYKGTHTHPSLPHNRTLRELQSRWTEVSDDGYRWRKYDEEVISGSPNPRSYYVCVSTDCPAKKQVQVSDEDPTIVKISYTGIHTCSTPFCEDPVVNKSCGSNTRSDLTEVDPKIRPENSGRIQVFEPEDSTLDNWYRLKKYGQKIVAGSKNPRTYYKCAYAGCPVRKRVQRSDEDLTMIETVYEGKHTHPNPPDDRSLHELQSSEMVRSDPLYPSNDEVDQNRRIVSSCSEWTDVSDDGYKWRKYDGEVNIGSPTPRSYYGCVSTNCSAEKQVLISDEDPTIFEITDTEVNTCSTPFCEDFVVKEPCDSDTDSDLIGADQIMPTSSKGFI